MNSSLSTCSVRLVHNKNLMKHENEIDLVSLREVLGFIYGCGFNNKAPSVVKMNRSSLNSIINYIESKINSDRFLV